MKRFQGLIFRGKYSQSSANLDSLESANKESSYLRMAGRPLPRLPDSPMNLGAECPYATVTSGKQEESIYPSIQECIVPLLLKMEKFGYTATDKKCQLNISIQGDKTDEVFYSQRG